MRLLIAASVAGGASATMCAQTVAAPELKALFLLNFTRFTEWPDLAPGTSLVLCVLGDERVLDALSVAAQSQHVNDHRIQVARMTVAGAWPSCHVLFVSGTAVKTASALLESVRVSPILTVSDQSLFAQSTGVIELYAEGERMKFAINVDSLQRAHLRISSRLLGLAKIVKSEAVQR
ncbi:MAG TPA: YfiR family protein [Vicinamibacterales bacterium]|nr:YfiR family protein [Vicinamibacterales bacterium]